MNRGEIWTVARGVYATEPRPAVIVQDDVFDATSSVTVAPMSSMLLDVPLMRVRTAGGDGRLSGFDHDSDVMIDKLTTVKRSNVGTRVGRLTAEQVVEVERAMMVLVGLARWTRAIGSQCNTTACTGNPPYSIPPYSLPRQSGGPRPTPRCGIWELPYPGQKSKGLAEPESYLAFIC